MDNGASSYRRYLNGDEEAFREIVKEYQEKDERVKLYQRLIEYMTIE